MTEKWLLAKERSSSDILGLIDDVLDQIRFYQMNGAQLLQVEERATIRVANRTLGTIFRFPKFDIELFSVYQVYQRVLRKGFPNWIH